MQRQRIILVTFFLFVLPLGTLAPSHFAQDTSTGAGKRNQQDPEWLFDFIRTINTAEVLEKTGYGSFAPWQTLLEHQQQYLNEWLTGHRSRETNAHFGNLPEILPGWNLRLNAHTDGKGYDLLLEAVGDKNGYAGISDERGVIRECKLLR